MRMSRIRQIAAFIPNGANLTRRISSLNSAAAFVLNRPVGARISHEVILAMCPQDVLTLTGIHLLAIGKNVGLSALLFAPDRRPTLLTSVLSRLETAPWRHSAERFSNPNQNFLRNPNALPPPDSHSLHAASGAIPRNSRLPRA